MEFINLRILGCCGPNIMRACGFKNSLSPIGCRIQSVNTIPHPVQVFLYISLNPLNSDVSVLFLAIEMMFCVDILGNEISFNNPGHSRNLKSFVLIYLVMRFPYILGHSHSWKSSN